MMGPLPSRSFDWLASEEGGHICAVQLPRIKITRLKFDSPAASTPARTPGKVWLCLARSVGPKGIDRGPDFPRSVEYLSVGLL